jgi:hypothetical protein
VRGYPKEDWIVYLMVRELSDRFPELKMHPEASVGGLPNNKKVDLSICDHATVELKGPHRVDGDLRIA